MPVRCEFINNKYRLVENDSGNVAMNEEGSPVDGGGHEEQEACQAQARAINAEVYGQE